MPINGINGNDSLVGTSGSDTINGLGGNDTIYGGAGDDTINGHGGNDLIYGGTGDDSLDGWQGNDTIYGGGNSTLLGGAGDDFLYFEGDKGALYGHDGNDYLFGKKTSGAQIHMYGGNGDDTIVMDAYIPTNWKSRDGHHAFGGRGNDKFVFENIGAATGLLIGRIDDFDNSRDSIWLGATKLNLNSLPAGVRIVEYSGHAGYAAQQWIVFHDKVAYALEGARKVSGDSVAQIV